ncbi:MAG: threonine synthase [Chloroflexi bacterium]|nr:threonine synthase [Chloroflexota bacterium]
MNQPLSWLECISCGEKYFKDARIYNCAQCGDLLDVKHDLETLKETVTLELFDKRLGGYEPWERSGVWRYKELVGPSFRHDELVTRGEGNTMLYPSPNWLAQYTGHANLELKHEGENPTGSFKDRGMTTGITQAKHLGAHAVICASTGNTSASMASYARLTGLQGVVAFPAGKVALGKIAQAIAYGATCLEICGDFDEAQHIVLEASQKLPVYLLNSVNPYRLEGQKTIMFEMLQQRRWRIPEWVVVPGGNLGNSSSFGKALMELHTLGLISRLPRIAIVQAEGANPFFRSWENGFKDFETVQAETLATAIRIGNPTNFSKAKRTIEWTNGISVCVTDQDILDAKACIDAAGIGCEPASAASVAGVKQMVENGIIKPHDEVVAVLTGHLLKDPGVVIDYHANELDTIAPNFINEIHRIDADFDALAAWVSQPEVQ